MNVLVLCGDHWHPARTPKMGLEPLVDAGFDFDFVEDAADWSAEKMDEYPVVLFTKSNDVSEDDETSWVTTEVEQAFVEYVRSGKGLLAVHSGTAEYGDTPLLRALLGGVFDHHPKQCPVTIEPFAGHPLAAGSTTFTIKDEHYFMEFDDLKAEVFMTTCSEHGTQPAGWTRTEGNGRVCVLTPGHNVDVWLHPVYQALLQNALRWCGTA